MKRFTTFACLMVALVFALGSFAGEMPRYVDGHNSVLHGGNLNAMKAASRDTVYLIGPWGSGAVVNGQFEDASGAAAWNGWTSIDLTQKVDPIWHVDTYNVVSGVYSAWCGEIAYEACTVDDAEGGYGSSYNELMVLRATVGNTGAATTVDVTAVVNHDTEPGYDLSNLGYYKADQAIAYLWTADGVGEAVAVAGTVTYAVGEYVGDLGNEVAVVWHVTSDGGWDDSDCSYYGDGALQVDDISVTVTNDGVVQVFAEDFETGAALAEQTDPASLYGVWAVEYPVGVGDYAHIRSQLGDEDPCFSNYSPQVCFIADDIMFNAGGNPVAYCQDWCYGPGGYIVNTQGGFAGPEAHLYNAIESPVIEWPEGDYLGVRFVFDAYRHEDLSADSPGMFYTWGIGSTDSGDPADPGLDSFADRNFVYYGGPDYLRGGEADATDLVVPGRTHVKVQLACYELGYIWGWDGDDGFPAPYFDNVALKCYDYYGPGMSSRELDLAQDNFPASGLIQTGADLGLNDIRFDMANNIALATDLRNDPGDSLVVDIAAVRTGSALVSVDDGTHTPPTLYFTMKLNPVFDATLRVGAGAFTVNAGTDGELSGMITDDGSVDGIMDGYVVGAPAVGNGIPSPSRWMFDLPDVDFMYPGDVLHYYIQAWDVIGGDFQDATMPADIEGFGDFDGGVLAYNSTYVVRGLPTMFDDAGDQPAILFWNDFANRGGQDEWHGAFANLGLFPGTEYDIYYTNGPSSGVGNGLGGRAQFGQLDGYDIMVYTAGDLSVNTISNLDYENDAGDDVGVVSDWLEEGGKSLFLTGDDLVSDLNQSGVSTQAFITSWLGVTWQANDARPLLGGDTAPMVYPVAGNTVFSTTESWLAYGGCRVINTFDALTVDGAESLAIFNDGVSGMTAAAKFVALNGSEIITMPYDFQFIRTPPTVAKAGQPAALPARARVLGEILAGFGSPPRLGFETGTGLPGVAFTANAYPNPFNPTTKIEFKMPKAGHLSLKVYDVRGQLVRTLIDEVRTESGFVMWDGTSDQGKRVSSGVYFYEARTNGQSVVNKMALVK